MREIALLSGKIYTAGTNFTRPLVMMVATNLNSVHACLLPEPHWQPVAEKVSRKRIQKDFKGKAKAHNKTAKWLPHAPLLPEPHEPQQWPAAKTI